MAYSFKAALERLARTPAEPRNFSGSSRRLDIVCERADWPSLLSIDAMRALVRRGLPLMTSKLAVELMIQSGLASVVVPYVDDEATLIAELARAGVTARVLDAAVDPAMLPGIRTAMPNV